MRQRIGALQVGFASFYRCRQSALDVPCIFYAAFDALSCPRSLTSPSSLATTSSFPPQASPRPARHQRLARCRASPPFLPHPTRSVQRIPLHYSHSYSPPLISLCFVRQEVSSTQCRSKGKKKNKERRKSNQVQGHIRWDKHNARVKMLPQHTPVLMPVPVCPCPRTAGKGATKQPSFPDPGHSLTQRTAVCAPAHVPIGAVGQMGLDGLGIGHAWGMLGPESPSRGEAR